MKKIIRYIFLALFILTVSSCDDDAWLTDVKIRSIDANDKWTSVSDLEMLLNGAYWHTSGEVWNDSQLDHGRILFTAESDIAAYLPNAGSSWEFSSSDMRDFYDRNNSNNNGSTIKKIWEGCYKSISSANEAIDYIENNPRFDDPNGWYPRIIGELHFIRAFNYYLLAKTFAPPYNKSGDNSADAFPLRTTPTTGLEDANMEPSSVGDVYALIVSDLQTAVENLPNSYEDASNPPASYADGRADKYAAAFLLARIYFQMGQWGESKSLCDLVIDNSGHELSGEPIDAWTKTEQGDPIGSEVIWFYQFYAGDGVGLTSNWKYHRTFDMMNATADKGGVANSRALSCSDHFMQSVGWMDTETLEETAEAQADLRYTQIYKRFEASDAADNPEPIFNFDRPYVWCNKYYRGSKPKNTSIPLFRLQEMYLTRAIITYLGENGASQNQNQALSDINAVREHAGLNALQSVTEDTIHNERMKELAFEGDRVFYLQALQKQIPPGDREGVGPISWSASELVYPVPTSETRFNNSYLN